MTTKIVNFIRSQLRKHRMFSKVCKDMLADTMKVYILRRSGYREEKFQSWCFNCGKSCEISLPSKDTECVLILKATYFWLYLDLNFLLWIVQPFTDEGIWRGQYTRGNNSAENDRTRHVTQFSESRSSCSRNKFVQHPGWIKKKALLPLNVVRQLWKTRFYTLFQGLLS